MSTEKIKTALAVQEARAEAESIYDALDIHRAALERKVPTGIMTYAYAEAALRTELRATPKLRECDPARLLGAFAYTLQLGLPLGPLGLVYLIPYKGEVVPVVGYRGYIELALQSGLVKDVAAHLVYEGQHFRALAGTSPKIEHELSDHPDDAAIVAAYAVAHLKTGGTVSRVIYERDWEQARKASQLGRDNRGPWAEYRPQMIRKTAYRRLEPQLPKTLALVLAATGDETPAEPFGETDYLPALEASAAAAAEGEDE